VGSWSSADDQGGEKSGRKSLLTSSDLEVLKRALLEDVDEAARSLL
jgi:hypothetical protein